MKKHTFFVPILLGLFLLSTSFIAPAPETDAVFAPAQATLVDFGAVPVFTANRSQPVLVATGTEGCPDGLRCYEMCLREPGGQMRQTGITCCVSNKFRKQTSNRQAIQQCMNNAREG